MKKTNRVKLSPNPKLDKLNDEVSALESERSRVETEGERKLEAIDKRLDKYYEQQERLESADDDKHDREVRAALRHAVTVLRRDKVDDNADISADTLEKWMKRNDVQL